MRIKSLVSIFALLCAAIAPAQNPDAGKVQVGTIIQASGPATPIRLTPTADTIPSFDGTTLVNRGLSAGGNGATDDGKLVVFGNSGELTVSTVYKLVNGTGYTASIEADSLTNDQLFSLPNDAGTLMVLNGAGGTPSSMTLTNATGLPISTGVSGLGANVATSLANAMSASGTLAILGANTFTGQQIVSLNGAASTPPVTLTGTWFSGGSATTTKPQLLIEPTGTTTNTWPTGGTGLGVNAPSGSTGDMGGFYRNGVAYFRLPGGAKPRLGSTETDGVTLVSQYGSVDLFAGGSNNWNFARLCATGYGSFEINSGGANTTYLYTESPGNKFQMGIDASTPSAQTFKGPDTTTNGNAGAALSLQGGNGLTTGAGGALNLDGGDSPSGTDGNVVIGGTRGGLTISGATTFSEAVNITLGTTTGTKIGTATTQKLGFFDAAPVAQQANVANPAGGALQDAEARAAIDAILSRLEALGLFAP